MNNGFPMYPFGSFEMSSLHLASILDQISLTVAVAGGLEKPSEMRILFMALISSLSSLNRV